MLYSRAMTSKTLQAWGAGCGYQLLLRLGAAVVLFVLLFGCMLVVTVVPLPNGVDRELVAAVGLIVVVAGLVGVTLVGAAALIIWRARTLDAALAGVGLAGRMLSLNGRQYHGNVSGRQVDAYFGRGPTLDVYVGTRLLTRLTVGRRDRVGQALAGLVNRTPLALDDVQLESLAIYPHDAAWTLQLLNDARVRDRLLRLTDDHAPGAGRFEIRQLVLQPEALLFRLHRVSTRGVTAEAVQSWLTDLAALLRLMEDAPPPTVTDQANAFERTFRSNRAGLTARTLIVLLIALGVLVSCLVGFGALSALVGGAS